MNRLEGKVALITGAGMGIGREAAVLFAAEGARIVVADINEEAARETVGLIQDAGGGAVAAIGDVASEDDVRRMIEEGIEAFGELTVLYGNAGVLWKDRDRSVLETDEKWWDRVMDINLKSAFWLCKYGVPHLKRAGGGSIILAGSVSALAGFTRAQDAYTAAKGGAYLPEQIAGDPVRAGQHTLQRHPPGHSRNAAASALSDGRDTRGVQVVDSAGAHSPAARDRQRGPVPGVGRGVLHHRRGAGGRRRVHGAIAAAQAYIRGRSVEVRALKASDKVVVSVRRYSTTTLGGLA